VALSNADERYYGVLEQLGIAQYFDHVCLSHTYGSEKPDPAFFHTMMDVCGISDPRECLHVGDSYKNDYLVAQSLGMHAAFMIRYARRREKYAHLLDSDIVLGMDDLLERLE
jgi:putative hydrolase of the HAD superfamily